MPHIITIYRNLNNAFNGVKFYFWFKHNQQYILNKSIYAKIIILLFNIYSILYLNCIWTWTDDSLLSSEFLDQTGPVAFTLLINN